MVFESQVVDLLNKFAGQYLENLDSSQLRIGIWGGDVQLESLILKESALNDLDLPVKVLRGHLGKLVLKIPWKNLYSEPVIAQIDGLYLLVRPNTVVTYNEEKEEKAKQEKKQRQLEAVELARKLEEEKKKNVSKKDEKSDSFVEKLAMQIVKNLQISVRNIHIRYEDSVTNPSSPFSIGVTLENLSAESTDENWIPAIVSSSVQLVHKLVKLDSLALYWNTRDNIGKLPSKEDWVNQAKGGIAIRTSKHYSPPGFKYILQPISATTKVKMNVKPGSDLSIPKIFLSLVLQEISLVLMRQQYHDVMKLLESFDRMATNSLFRKYKPNSPLHGHAKEWWKYAITSILEEDVKRRFRNWSWSHMKEHRDLCRKYKDLYKKKLLQNKPSDSLDKNLEGLERQLDVLNITICRRQAAFEEAAALRKKKKKEDDKKGSGWFSGLFGSSKRSKKEDQTEILTEEQRKEELEKLYSAIGYSEGEVITAFPKEYVDNKVIVHLKQISVALRDDTEGRLIDVARLSFQDLFTDLSQRTSAQAIKITAKVDLVKMYGCSRDDGKMPLIITSPDERAGTHLALFNASFETNPLDGKCDQRAVVSAQPVKVTYDANTVEHMVTFFQPPKDVQLSELSAAAYSRLEDLKSASKASLSYAIEHHKITDVNVDVKSPLIIIPEQGIFEKSRDVLVIDLGHLKITSDPDQERIVSTKDLSMEDLESKCYDKFDFRLEDLQILIAKAGDDWQTARKQVKSKKHILDPIGMDMKLQKALNPDDIRLAQIKLSGSLPFVKVRLSDKKLQQIIKLVNSIPIPGGDSAVDQLDAIPVDIPIEGRWYNAKAQSDVGNFDVLEVKSEEKFVEEEAEMFITPPETPTSGSHLEKAKQDAKEAMAKQVKVSLDFAIEQILVDVSTVAETEELSPWLELSITGLGTNILMHPWDLTVSASLGSMAVKEMTYGHGGDPLYLVETPDGAELLSLKYMKVESDHPEYKSRFNSTQQSIDIEFSSLRVELHQEALLNIIDLSTKMLPPSEDSPHTTDNASKEQVQDSTDAPLTDARQIRKKENNGEEVQVKVTAKLGGIGVTVTSTVGELSHIIIGGLSAYCVVKNSATEVTARMKDLSVIDSTPGTLYPKIVSIANQEVFSLQVVAYNDATSGSQFRNMEAVDVRFQMTVGCIRVVFLTKFVMHLVDFLNKFQTAKDAMEYARKSAAESATATLQNLQSQSSRISLSVSIQAPLIIIPVRSTSYDAFVASLGHLDISNSFNLAVAGENLNGTDSVVVDKMVVDLSSVQLSRAIMTDGETVGPTRHVLDPLHLVVYLSRSLSPWYHKIPDIDVTGKLLAVKLCAGEDDIRTMMGILLQNLSEGTFASQTEITQLESIAPVVQQGLEAGVGNQSTDITLPDGVEEVWDSVKFSFEIEEVSAAVFWKETAKPTEETCSREAHACLGQFSLVHVTTSGQVKSNSVINATVTLETCMLDDKRPESEEGVTRMIERFDGSSSEANNMIEIMFEQALNQDKMIVMLIRSFYVVVNLEFLMVLSNVFMSAMVTEESARSALPAIHQTSQAIMKELPITMKTADEEPSQITVQIQIKDPEIALLADARDKDTYALFLKNSLDFHFVQSQEQQKMSGSISDLVITSAAFDKDRRRSTTARVLQLSHISLVSSAPEGGNMHVDVSAAMAYVHISPPAVKTLTACLMSLYPAKSGEDETKSSLETLELLTEKPITAEERWYLSPVPEDQLVPGRRVLARSLLNMFNYDPGFVVYATSNVLLVHVDDSPPMFIDPNDIAAVVIDKVPDSQALHIGAQVIAKRPKETSYVAGRILQKKWENGEKLYLVDFWDGIEQWNTLDKIRVLTTVKAGVPKGEIVESTIVYVRYTDKIYRKGFVKSKTYSKLVVGVYCGEVKVVHANDSAAVVPDIVPDMSVLQIGSSVIATVDGFFWEAGHIAEIRNLEEAENLVYRVRFIGGGDTWVFNLNNIRILMERHPKVPEGVLGSGTVVWARSPKENAMYYKGFISYKGTKLHIDLYRGEKLIYESRDASCMVIPEIPPKAAEIKPGTRVIAKYKDKLPYYSATVIEVDGSQSSEPKYHVKFDNGEQTWDSLYLLRILPKENLVGAVEEKAPDHIEVENARNDKAELLVFSMDGFDLKVEGTFAGQVIPLLSVDGSIQGQLRNWSSALSFGAGVNFIGKYFNERVSEWEPLIEPVVDDRSQTRRDWEIMLEFSMANGDSNETNLGDSSEAAMSLSVESKDILELTVTKTCLEVLTKLGAAFKEAVTLQSTGGVALEDVPPYQIWNELGMEVKLRPGNKFESPASAGSDGMVAIAHGQSLSLRLGKRFDRRVSRFERGGSISGSGLTVGIEVQGYHEVKTISVKEARVVLLNIIPKKLFSGVIISVVVQVESGEGQRTVTIRSPLQINNHFPIPMDLMCKKEEQFSRVTTVEPDSVYSVPLMLAHRAALYLRPAGFGYGESSPLLWNKLAFEGHSSIKCSSPAGDGPPFHIEVDCERVSYASVHGSLEHAPNYILHIYPPAILHNYLPYNIRFVLQDLPLELKGGDKWPLFSVNLDRKVRLRVEIENYQQSNWHGVIELWKEMDELTTFTLGAAYGKQLELGVFATFEGTLSITLYSPYWMVNKTDLYLEYMASDDDTVILHPGSVKEPVMFSYRRKGNIFAKRTARVRLATGEWSMKFSLDAAGSGGLIKVNKDGKLHEVGVQTTLSYFSLTKIVEFTPFHLINNATEYPLSLTDSPDLAAASWVTVQPGKCVPFWPISCPSKNLALRFSDSTEVSPRFNFEPDVTFVLKINKVEAVCADMLAKDSAAIITITPYYHGAAPVRLENCTQLDICYKQRGCKEHCLHPNQCVLFTWDEPSCSKEFVWFVKGSQEMTAADLSKTRWGEFEHESKKFYWAAFLEGLQRVLLIIDDFTLAFRAQVEQKEPTSQRITLGLEGVGLSLVNDEKSVEVAYIGIRPSDVIWEEQRKKGRWKAMKVRLCDELEAAWTTIQNQISAGATPNYIYKTGDIEIDFQLMEIVRPNRQAIRRSFAPGVSLEYVASPNELEFNAKINFVQIDSQVPGATFQTVLYPIPPPKSLAADNAPKPYIELSLATKQKERSHVQEIKYFKVLIQEMEVKADMGFLMALFGLFSSDTIDRSQEAIEYSLDKQRVHDSLGDAFAVQAALSDGRNFFDYFHLSPLKVHLSFSQLGGAAEGGNKTRTHIGGSFLSLLLQSVGVAVTEVQDVEFKLAYFEIKSKVYTQQQLIQVAVKHYRSQAIKQLYVLVLGLDVLGNPFGLITGLKDGAIDFFYEPYQGLIQGPGEFAEGLAIGARSLFGHTVGGAAGAVSRITGTLGKGIAALTMDDKHQHERRQVMGKKPVGVKEGLTRGGKGLFEGVVGGVTGIVTKPMEGAKEAGTAGFFKGLGKGVVGVLARPAGGLVDFASSTLEGIKGSASTGSAVRRLRPPRCFYSDKVIKPYNLYQAQGNAVLQEVKKTKCVLVDDTYFCHSNLNIKKTLIVTNKHIIVAGKTEVFEAWECDWMCGLHELKEEPTTDGHKLVLRVPDRGSKKGIFKRNEQRSITTPNPDVAKWLVDKIKEARS
ncbi:intermembrane lipid transfer protein VPS13A-like [Montipora capricornis]|uniref:intermembrane lipid transfer protein VPS13A-like n=1 Tax=Montipora capricornis TaxID=246305 RepID=UPI0035F12218